MISPWFNHFWGVVFCQQRYNKESALNHLCRGTNTSTGTRYQKPAMMFCSLFYWVMIDSRKGTKASRNLRCAQKRKANLKMIQNKRQRKRWWSIFASHQEKLSLPSKEIPWTNKRKTLNMITTNRCLPEHRRPSYYYHLSRFLIPQFLVVQALELDKRPSVTQLSCPMTILNQMTSWLRLMVSTWTCGQYCPSFSHSIPKNTTNVGSCLPAQRWQRSML